MYCRLIDGSLVTLSKAKYARTDPQILSTYHVPLSDINGAIPLGLDWQTWTISGVIADSMSVRWHDIIWLSLDNIAWRACRVQATAFPTNNYQQSTYELTVLVSPILEGAAVRYPTTGYKFGLQSITGISQAGNVSAFPTIHYLAPLFYAPLSNMLVDFAGQSVTFTRTASKAHNGITYPINTPIFDSGLYLGSDVAQDVATWTPPASTVRTVAMQIKRAALSISDTFSALDTSKWIVDIGTVIVTGGSLVVGQVASGYSQVHSSFNIDASRFGTIVFWACLPRETAATNLLGTSNAMFSSTWNDNGHIFANGIDTGIAAGTTLREFKIIFPGDDTAAFFIDGVWKATVGITNPSTQSIQLTTYAGGTYIYVNDIGVTGFSSLPASLNIWTSAHNGFWIDVAANLIKWSDGTSTVSLALPAVYLSGTVMDVVVIEDTAHAVTIAVHPAGGSWTSATGTLAALTWPQLTLGNLEGSIANLVEYPYVLTSAEYQALAYSSLSLLFNSLYVGNRYAGEVIKGSDKRLLNAAGSDISALLGGTDIAIGASAVTIAQTAGLAARWYVELKRTDV